MPRLSLCFPEPVRITDRRGIFRCPRCGDGKQQKVTHFNCLKALYPKIAEELDDQRNKGITGENVLPSYKEKLWFICPYGHHYQSRLSNRTFLNRGCPKCAKRGKTSFAEQAVRFYLQKCDAKLQSCQTEPFTRKEVDILLPSCKSIVEFNSLYYHTTVNGRRPAADLKKVYKLIQYYCVYIIQEEGTTLPIQEHPLIRIFYAPVFSLTEKICCKYNDLIYKLLRTLFPERDYYPNIDIMRDQLLILQQYIFNEIEDSFEKHYPLLAADWHPIKNGTLTPSMFHSNSLYKFYWICRSCGRTYQISIANRIKVNPDTCPNCCHKSQKYKSSLLCENYPFLKLFWSIPLNQCSFSQVHVSSEKIGIFELLDGRIVSVSIHKLSAWLHSHPNSRPEEYLEKQWKISNKQISSLK